MENKHDGAGLPAILRFANAWDSREEAYRQRLLLSPMAVEQDLVFWLDACGGNSGEEGEEGFGPLDVWERQWSWRMLPRLHEVLSLGRLQPPGDAPVWLEVSASELGYLACRLVAIRRLFRMLFRGDRDGVSRLVRLGTLPETWKRVLAEVTPVTPYPALAPRGWLETEVIPCLKDNLSQSTPSGSMQLLAVLDAAVRSSDDPDVLILAPLGVLVQLYEMAREFRARATDLDARQRAERTLATLRITLTEEIVERGNACRG